MTGAAGFEVLLNEVAERPVAMARLAGLLLLRGQVEQAREMCARAISLAPEDEEVRILAAEVFSHDVPHWYFSMVLDNARHRLYETAFRRVIKPGYRVLDIGTGTGLFAMMAARAGACEVVSCEARPVVAAVATEVIAHNGLSGRVRVIGKRISELEIVDLGGPADVVIWDNLARNLIGAGALQTIEQAVRRLARPGAHIIPARGAIRVALAEDRETQYEQTGIVAGFDLTPFNQLAMPRYKMTDEQGRFVLRSDAADLFIFDFESGGPFPEARASAVLTSRGGRVNGIAQWIWLELADEVEYENFPPSAKTASLSQVFNPVCCSMETSPGFELTIRGAHDRETLRVWAERITSV